LIIIQNLVVPNFEQPTYTTTINIAIARSRDSEA
jgi:hypothetical protein